MFEKYESVARMVVLQEYLRSYSSLEVLKIKVFRLRQGL